MPKRRLRHTRSESSRSRDTGGMTGGLVDQMRDMSVGAVRSVTDAARAALDHARDDRPDDAQADDEEAPRGLSDVGGAAPLPPGSFIQAVTRDERDTSRRSPRPS